MKRRTFLSLSGSAGLGLAAAALLPRARAAAPIDRKSKWAPNATDVVQWRYLAGRITESSGDFGFVISLTDLKLPTQTQELLVERQDFGGQAFATNSYTGALTYNSGSATYSFQDAQSQASASWQWDDTNQVYHLSVASPELNLQNLVLRPQGDLIPETGDGTIAVAPILGVPLGSDYYADWVAVEIGGVAKGVARLDMQGLYPSSAARRLHGLAAPAAPDYDHHWFAIAGETVGTPVSTPVWISAWRIEAAPSPLWDVTIAQGSGAAWQVGWTTEASAVAEPLEVWPLAWQPLPATAGPGSSGLRTGRTWRLSAGVSQPGDLIALEVAVPAGQFANSVRLGAVQGLTWVEEAVGVVASGTGLGKPLSNVRLVVAETTAEFYLQQLPLAQR
jgi:hypothetical protein